MMARGGRWTHDELRGERHIILAFALAANEGNIAAEDLELAASDGDRQAARKSVESARN
jgi:hypothetical protein